MAKDIENFSNVLLRIPNDLLKEIDKLATKNGLTRTSQMIVLLREYFRQNKALDIMNNMVAELKKDSKTKIKH